MSTLTPEKRLELEEAAYQIRRLAIEMITYARWGHPGGSLSMADIMAVLYFHTMDTDPKNPKWEDRDRLILSKAHTSPALYAALALKDFFHRQDVDPKEYHYGDSDHVKISKLLTPR
jgi:transketolase